MIKVTLLLLGLAALGSAYPYYPYYQQYPSFSFDRSPFGAYSPASDFLSFPYYQQLPSFDRFYSSAQAYSPFQHPYYAQYYPAYDRNFFSGFKKPVKQFFIDNKEDLINVGGQLAGKIFDQLIYG